MVLLSSTETPAYFSLLRVEGLQDLNALFTCGYSGTIIIYNAPFWHLLRIIVTDNNNNHYYANSSSLPSVFLLSRSDKIRSTPETLTSWDTSLAEILLTTPIRALKKREQDQVSIELVLVIHLETLPWMLMGLFFMSMFSQNKVSCTWYFTDAFKMTFPGQISPTTLLSVWIIAKVKNLK